MESQTNLHEPETIKAYDTLCNSFNDSYAPYIRIKKAGSDKEVYTMNRGKINLNDRARHIAGEQMTGGRGKWYPVYFIFDIDTQNINVSRETIIRNIAEALSLKPAQYLATGSMSFYEKENLHIYIRPEWNGKPGTLKRTRERLLPIAGENGIELYPQIWRKVCDPLSPYQPVLGKNLYPLKMELSEAIEKFNNLEAVDISELPGQQIYFDIKEKANNGRPVYMPDTAEALDLVEHGLQHPGTRHNAILKIACHYALNENIEPGQACRMIYSWVINKHNGQSKDINAGKMTPERLHIEIEKAASWAYSKYMRTGTIPTPAHNVEYGIAQTHLDSIAALFPADLVNQRRLFNLLCYVNPRNHWNYIYIHRDIWDTSAGHGYKRFQDILKAKGILTEPKHNIYIPGQQSKRYKLHIPQDKNYIAYNGRNSIDYDLILKQQPVEYLKNRLKISTRSMYNIKHYKKPNLDFNAFIQG